MKLRVQYMAQLRPAMGRMEEDVELPEGSTVVELLVHLASRHDEAGPHLVTRQGQARPSLLVVVNGSAVPAQESAAAVLHSGDVVILLPPIAGG